MAGIAGIWRIWLSIFFLCSFLHAQEKPMQVNSGSAAYDGKIMVLTGDVVVQHSLGRISARLLSFNPQAEKQGNQPSLQISGSVEILLNGGGELQCQQADVDYAKMKGIFLGNAEFPDVVYRNEGEKKTPAQGEVASIEVKSGHMTLDLIREAGADSSSRTVVRQIEAVQNVRVGYDKDYLLLADHALYQRLSNTGLSSSAGLLTLSVQGIRPFCRLTNVNGDSLQAKTIQVNTADRKIWLAEPQGKLLMQQDKESFQTLEFKSDELSWDHQKQVLVLKGNVDISQNKNLHVKTGHEISIFQGNLKGKRILRSIRSPEKTDLEYVDALKGNTRRIYSPGPLLIDHERQEMTLTGILDGSEPTEEKNQVYFEDVLGEMYADLVRILYHWEGSQLVPKQVIMEGHVRLLNRFDGHVEEAGSVLHYALADRVEYSPEQQEMVLTASEGNRVLFFDQVNNMQMSAPSLTIRQDPASKKEMIKGIGDVRFTFLEKELAQFKQHFKQKDSSREGAEHGK